MAENITYPAYDAMLAGSTTNDTWSDGTQFSIGNTTYAWDPTPGLWRAFTTATSSGGGEAGTAPVGSLAGLSNRTVMTFSSNETFTNDTGTTLYGKIGGLVPSLTTSIQITGAGAWAYRGSYREQGQRSDRGLAPAFATAIDDTAVNLPISGGSNTDQPFGWDGELFLPPGATVRTNNLGMTFWYGSVIGATGGATVNIGGAGGQVYFGNTPATEPAESMGSLFYRYDTTDPANDTNTTIYNRFYINVGNNTWREFASGNPNSELRFAPLGLDAIVEPNWASPTEQITATGTWTVPTTLTDTQWVFFYLIGGGGGTAQSDGGRATGGGAGASLFAVPAASLTEASYAITIGAGGSGAERGSGLATASAGGTTILDFDASSLYGSGLTILSAGGGGGANANGSVRNPGIGGFGNFQWYDADHAHTTNGAAGQGLTRAAADYATGTGLRGGTGGAPTGSGSTVFGGAATGVTTVFAGTFGQGGPNSNNRNGLAGVFRVYY